MNKECPSADKTLLSVAIFQPAAWIITHVAHISDTEGCEASACRLATQGSAQMWWPLAITGHWSGSCDNLSQLCPLGHRLAPSGFPLLQARASTFWPVGAGTDGDGPPCALGKPRLVRSPLRAKKGKKARRASIYESCRRSGPCATHLDTHHIASSSQQKGGSEKWR